MERTWQGEQDLADIVKRKPQDQNPQEKLGDSDESTETKPLDQRGLQQFPQTRGTEDPIFMLRDAFTAEAAATFWTPSHGLSKSMIEAALVGQILHASSHPGGAFSPWEVVDVPEDDRFSRRKILSKTSPEIPMPEEQTMENT
jgi:hypothetical protein